MKISALVFFIIAVFTAMAGVEESFNQFIRADGSDVLGSDVGYYYGTLRNQGNWKVNQGWSAAAIITLHVPANSTVYLTNYISNWKGSNADLDEIFDMSAGNYGYINASSLPSLNLEKSDYYTSDYINFSNGESIDITYYDDNDATGNTKYTTPGYYLGSFDEASDIYLVMTPKNRDELVDTYQYVQDGYHEETDLLSRQYNTTDQAGNVRVNLGISAHGNGSHEFVAVYSYDDFDEGGYGEEGGGSSGQPLPGLFLATILAIGTIAFGKSLKKRV